MTPAPTAPTAPTTPAAREAAIAAGHHPLAWCEFCGRKVPGVLADCPDPVCQRKALDQEMYFVRLEDGLDDRWAE